MTILRNTAIWDLTSPPEEHHVIDPYRMAKTSLPMIT